MIDLNDFMNSVNMGLDIEFAYKGRRYTILAWHDPIIIGEQNTDNEWLYKDADDMFNNFIIDNIAMKDFIKDIEILFW
ncbi:MAG: hypothetical protein K2G31_03440 [Clostridia bacterium]|nr:hypothetical protein [Clostridia bacterium]